MARKLEPKKLPSDYERQIRKNNQKRKGRPVPQLGEQSKQSVPDLKVLSDSEMVMIDFVVQTNLTKAQLRGEDDIPTAPLAARKPFELGQPLMWPALINHLPTKMHALHRWYLKAFAEGQMVISALVKDEHYFRGTDEIMIFFEEFCYLYHQDALDKSLLSAWVL